MGVCLKCGDWLRQARGIGGLQRIMDKRPPARDLQALRDHFAPVTEFGGGKIRAFRK